MHRAPGLIGARVTRSARFELCASPRWHRAVLSVGVHPVKMLLVLICSSAWQHTPRSSIIRARDTAIASQAFAKAAACQAELDDYVACLRGDPKLLPASMLVEARQDAIEREDFRHAAALQSEISEACRLAEAPSTAFASIFHRSGEIICRYPDSEELGTSCCYSASLPEATPAQVYALFADPARWPECMFFSSALNGLQGGATDLRTQAGVVLQGATFREVAGAPPLLPVQFTWSCTRADDFGSEGGLLEFEATDSDVGEARRSIRISTEDGQGGRTCSVQLETSCSAPSQYFKVMQLIDERFFSLLLSSALAAEGGPLGGFSVKSAIVWIVLISAWAVSSFGWLASFGLAGGAVPV